MTSVDGLKKGDNSSDHIQSDMEKLKDRWSATMRVGGISYTCMYTLRMILDRMLDKLDEHLVGIEQRKQILTPWSILARRFTVADNKQRWNTWDWSSLGEEWTPNAQWKEDILRTFLLPNIPEGKTVVEIGPGGGRWTEILQRRCKQLFIVDVSERVIEVCRERFSDCSNIDYVLGEGGTINIPDTSADAIWSFDVFVHINPIDARSYFQEFARILKPGGRAVIHHPRKSPSQYRDNRGWRSDLTNEMILDFNRDNQLKVLSQSGEHIKTADVVTVIEKSM